MVHRTAESREAKKVAAMFRRSSLIGPKIGVCPEPIGRAIV